MYLHAPDALAQPPKQQLTAKENAKEVWEPLLRDCWKRWGEMRDAYEFTRRDWKEAMRDLAKCQKSLDAAQAALKAA